MPQVVSFKCLTQYQHLFFSWFWCGSFGVFIFGFFVGFLFGERFGRIFHFVKFFVGEDVGFVLVFVGLF